MNDPLVAELAAQWGEQALEYVSESDRDAAMRRVEWMYLSAFGRRPTPQESEAAMTFLAAQASKQGVTNADADLWKTLAHVLVNTKEFIFLR